MEKFVENPDNLCCVYAHINKINGKMYIGITNNVMVRWSSVAKYKGCPAFYRAIQKYGWDNFEHMIIIDGIQREIASIMEKELIKKYKTQDYQYGYNITDGGYGVEKNQIGLVAKPVYQYDLDGNYIKTWKSASEAGRFYGVDSSCISAVANGVNNSYLKFMWKDYYAEHIQPYIKVDKHKKRQPIIQINFNGEIVDIHQNLASNYNSSQISNIIECCENKKLTAYNCFWVYESDFKHDTILNLLHEKKTRYWYRGKKVNMYNLDGELLQSFDTPMLAEEITKISHKAITSACCGFRRDHKMADYLWYYDCDENRKKISSVNKTPSFYKNVYQFSLDGNFITKYESLKQAQDTIKYFGLGEKIRHHKHEQRGYLWFYKEQLLENKDKYNLNIKEELI